MTRAGAGACAAALALAALAAGSARAQEGDDFDQWLAQILFAVDASSRSTSNQTETPAMATNSSTLVDRSSASDLIGIALNLDELSGSSENDSESDVSSAAATVTAYAFYAAAAGFDPLDPARYCDPWARRARWLSGTLGFDDGDLGSADDTTLAGAKLEIPLPGAKDECDRTAFAGIAAANKQAARAYGEISRAVRLGLFELALEEAGESDPDRTVRLQRFFDQIRAPGLGDDERFGVFSNGITNDADLFHEVLGAVGESEFVASIRSDFDREPFEKLDTAARDAIAEFRQRPRLAVEFVTNQRSGSNDDYQVMGIFDVGLRKGLKFVANGGWENRDMPASDAANGASLAFEFELDLAPGTLDGRRGLRFAASGHALWLDDAPDRYQAQMRVTIPLLEGVEIPLTLTIADRTRTDDDTEVRGGVHFSVDTMMLADWLRDLR